MKQSRVLITGCGGMLGNAIYPYFRDNFEAVYASDIQIEQDEISWLNYLDVRDDISMSKVFREFMPDLVLHLAAITNIEDCENDEGNAIATNTTGTRTAAKLAAEHRCKLVYISTAGVFDGMKGDFYTEDDTPNPIMVYGHTKLNGEVEARDNCPNTFVVRPGWMVGGGPKNDHKFVSYILDHISSGEKEIFAVTDKVGTPTYTHDFAINLKALVNLNAYGTYHMVCSGSGSRFHVAEEIVKICGHDNIKVKPVNSDYFQHRFWAPRPSCEMLKNQALENKGINLMRDWRIALKDYLYKDYTHLLNTPFSTIT